MTEHSGTSFFHSCVKMPVDPCSRQPTPSYERPQIKKTDKINCIDKRRKINFMTNDKLISESDSSSPREGLENFLDFLESIPDYGQVHHLSNEQFKRKVEYLRRKQKLFLKNFRNNSTESNEKDADVDVPTFRADSRNSRLKQDDLNDLKLNGTKCFLEESRTSSPILYPSGSFAGLAEDQDLLTYRCKDKEKKTMRNNEIHSANKSWSTWSESKSDESLGSDEEENIETKSLPPEYSKEWHPTVPKPFSFTLREDAEKYMNELEDTEKTKTDDTRKTHKKRRVRPIPLTSKIPLYDKLMAEKEERSRIVREESALNLMSQVRPFKLECDRRAWRSLTRSSPEVCTRTCASSRFKAKPVPKNLFGTEVYDRMLEDEYYRQLKKKVRAAELMKASSLPPSMARRERVKSASVHLENTSKDTIDESRDSSRLTNLTEMTSERSRSALMTTRGNNLASILRCQASREKLERELREKMEEKRREQEIKLRESFISRKPVWRALRCAARHEHARDIDIRTSLRRDEAREQAERHRLQMELMLDRVTQIPTLFERHSQNFQLLSKPKTKMCTKHIQRHKKKLRRQNSNSSYASYGSNSRPNSGSVTSSSGTLDSRSHSSKTSKSSDSGQSEKSIAKSDNSAYKKKGDRGPLKVSINETAQLIEDQDRENFKLSTDHSFDEEQDEESDSDDNGIAKV